MGADAKISSSVIQLISVYVINFHSLRGICNDPMNRDCFSILFRFYITIRTSVPTVISY